MNRLPIDQAALASLCRRHHIARLSLFGSVPKGDDRPNSDIVLLVEFEVGETRIVRPGSDRSGAVGPLERPRGGSAHRAGPEPALRNRVDDIGRGPVGNVKTSFQESQLPNEFTYEA